MLEALLADGAAAQLVGGGCHSLLLLPRARRLYAWGWGEFSQLSGESTSKSLEPRVVSLPAHEELRDSVRPSAAAAGWDFSAFVDEQGRVFTWGNNAEHQSGHACHVGSVISQPTPLPSLGVRVRALSCGVRHSVAVTGACSIALSSVNRLTLPVARGRIDRARHDDRLGRVQVWTTDDRCYDRWRLFAPGTNRASWRVCDARSVWLSTHGVSIGYARARERAAGDDLHLTLIGQQTQGGCLRSDGTDTASLVVAIRVHARHRQRSLSRAGRHAARYDAAGITL